jgi:NADH-quinone oxidoreductase subunit E
VTVRRLAEQQPESFAFTPENRVKADREISKYPEGRQHSAVLALLWQAQLQSGGWLPEPAIRHVADVLQMPHIRALEIATFYVMFNLAPVGKKAHVQVCGTTPCMLRGAEELKQICRERIHPEQYHPSDDGDFSWVEVECAGACVNAPMVQIDSDTYEDLTPDTFVALLDDIAAGRKPKPGPQIDRQFSAPVGGPTTLTDTPAPRASAPEAEATAPPPVAEPKRRATEAPAKTAAPLPPIVDAASADDLKQITGIGPKLEQKLHALGIKRFAEIAAWSAEDVARVDDQLNFRGRIDRDKWVEQAKALAAESGEGR